MMSAKHRDGGPSWARHCWTLALVGGVLATCMMVRAVVQEGMWLGQEIPIIPGLFSLRYLRNRGGAFSLFASTPEWFRLLFFVSMGVLALIAIILLYVRDGGERWHRRVGLAMLAGGGAANLLERLLVGDVVDYLDVYVGSYHWPTFNLADTAITAGISLLLLDVFGNWPAPGRSTGNRG
jgi:signal peptidase II